MQNDIQLTGQSAIFVRVASGKVDGVVQAIERMNYNAGTIQGGPYNVAADCGGRKIGEIDELNERIRGIDGVRSTYPFFR